jgi:serine/threonine-protein kinase ULK2
VPSKTTHDHVPELSQQTRRPVAIKTVRRHNLSAKLFENLQSEIEILKSLSHRHITKLIDIVV